MDIKLSRYAAKVMQPIRTKHSIRIAERAINEIEGCSSIAAIFKIAKKYLHASEIPRVD